MTRSLPVPNFKWPTLGPLPPSLQKWVKPMLFLSLGVHAAILFTPLPTPPPPAKPKPDPVKNSVKITALPTLDKKVNPLKKPRLLSKPLTKPKLALPPQKGIVLPNPAKKTSLATPVPKPKSSTPTAEPKAQPSVTPDLAPPVEDTGTQDTSNPMSDFPHFPGAVPGCLGVPSCYATGKPLAAVAQHFEQQLAAKKYGVQPNAAESDRKVYQISKGGVNQFLTILFDGTSANYVLAPQPLTLADLQGAVQVPAEFTEQILAQVSGAVSPDNLANPKDFYTELGGVDEQGFDINPVANPEIDSLKRSPDQNPQQTFDGLFNPSLTQLGYQVTPVASGFGGGLLFEVKKSTFKPFYLNLVPAKDGKGTVVVVWRSRPT